MKLPSARNRLYRHTLEETSADPLLFEETDERFRNRDRANAQRCYLILLAASHTTSEVRFLPAGNPAGEFRVISPREDSHEYYAEHHPRLDAGSRRQTCF